MLVKYEFLKILRKKSTIAVMLVSLLVTAFFFGLPVMQYYTMSQDAEYRGLEGIRYQKEQYENITVPLTDEYIEESIKEVQQLFEDPNNIGYDGQEQFLIDEAYWDGIAYRENLLNMFASNFVEPNVTVGYNSLLSIDTSNGIDFYQARQDKIEKIINMPSRGLSETQKEYWLDMNSKVETPLQYGYYEGWQVINSCYGLLVFAIMAVCIILCPIFSGEYQAGTDAVILSAKYGKTKLTTAKIIASVLFGLIAFTLHIIVAFGIPLLAFGIDGWNLPMQIANTTIPYPFTFLQGALINLGVIYLVLLAMISLTLFLSAKVKSPYIVLIVLFPIIFVPMFLSPNGTTGLYNLILFLTPYQSTNPLFAKYLSYQFGGIVLDTFSIRAILYVVMATLLFPLARLGFKKHQVA